MTSIWDPFHLLRSGSGNLEYPKSVAGILTHRDEEDIMELWINIVKTEEGCSNLKKELFNYKNAISAVDEADGKLLKGLEGMTLVSSSLALNDAVGEYMTVVEELHTKTKDTATTQKILMDIVKYYHGLFDHLDLYRKKRDQQVIEVEKSTEKIDKLKLKGKRTTDVRIEREKSLKQLTKINSDLLKDARAFHNLRLENFQFLMHALVHMQVDYYGSCASIFNNCIHSSRNCHQISDTEFQSTMGDLLKSLTTLKIVGT